MISDEERRGGDTGGKDEEETGDGEGHQDRNLRIIKTCFIFSLNYSGVLF